MATGQQAGALVEALLVLRNHNLIMTKLESAQYMATRGKRCSISTFRPTQVCIHAESPARTGRDHTLHESAGLLSERNRGPGRSGLMFDKAAFLHPCHIYRQGEDGTGKRVFLQPSASIFSRVVVINSVFISSPPKQTIVGQRTGSRCSSSCSPCGENRAIRQPSNSALQ